MLAHVRFIFIGFIIKYWTALSNSKGRSFYAPSLLGSGVRALRFSVPIDSALLGQD